MNHAKDEKRWQKYVRFYIGPIIARAKLRCKALVSFRDMSKNLAFSNENRQIEYETDYEMLEYQRRVEDQIGRYKIERNRCDPEEERKHLQVNNNHAGFCPETVDILSLS